MPKKKRKRSYLDANRLQSRFSSRRNSDGCSTIHSKSIQQSFSDSGDIVVGDTKGGSGFSDVGDEPTDFVLVQSHELVHFVHGGSAWVGLDGGAEEGASEKSGEVGVEVGEKDAVHEGGGILLVVVVCGVDWIDPGLIDER